ncbi:MAG: hypothetical protein ACLGSD_09370 [Acidobacteriota bacterium]
MRKFPIAGFICLLFAAPLVFAQTAPAPVDQNATLQADNEAAKNTQQARNALNAMVKALGGDAWLNMQNRFEEGRAAGFYQGKPDLGTMQLYEYHAWPDKDRIEVTKHRDVVEFFVGNQGWEVTYRGKRPLPKDQVDDYLRRRNHSIEMVVKVWMKDPKSILTYEGQHLADRHLADQVTVISPQNDAVTILMDADTHLPLQRVFQWRDPVYHDKNTDTEEYDDYHIIDGFPTPLNVTRMKNGDMVSQFYLVSARYNQKLPENIWDVDAAARRIKKR